MKKEAKASKKGVATSDEDSDSDKVLINFKNE